MKFSDIAAFTVASWEIRLCLLCKVISPGASVFFSSPRIFCNLDKRSELSCCFNEATAWQVRLWLLYKFIMPEATVIDVVSTAINESSRTALHVDCEQSLFCSKIHGEERKSSERASVATRGSQPRHSLLVCHACRLECALRCKCSATKTVL